MAHLLMALQSYQLTISTLKEISKKVSSSKIDIRGTQQINFQQTKLRRLHISLQLQTQLVAYFVHQAFVVFENTNSPMARFWLGFLKTGVIQYMQSEHNTEIHSKIQSMMLP